MAEIQTDKVIRCVACGKVIAKGAMRDGAIEIPCKCGVMNRIEARKKPEGRCGVPRFVGAIAVPAGHNAQ